MLIEIRNITRRDGFPFAFIRRDEVITKAIGGHSEVWNSGYKSGLRSE